MTLEVAKIQALNYFKALDTKLEIVEILNTNNRWIFIGGVTSEVLMDTLKITIDKNSGEIEKLILPSKEGLKLMKEATKINDGEN